MKLKHFAATFSVLLTCSNLCAQPQHHRHHRRMAFATDTVMAHDPVMAYENGVYYLLSTGMGIQWATSKDRKTWVVQPTPFIEKLPAWTYDSVPGFRSHVWAPDIVRWHDRWWLSYSCSTFGRNTSAIGLMSAERLDGQWRDEGCLVASKAHRDPWNAIDSNIAIGDDDQPWLVWGSFWDGIQLAKIGNADNDKSNCNYQLSVIPKTIARRVALKDTLKAAPNPTSKYAGRNAIEAPFIFKKNGYYYLFVSWDYCCRGAKSNYRVVMGRSRHIDGPYLDRNGRDMAEGGGTLFLEGDKQEYEAAGHCAVYTLPKANGGVDGKEKTDEEDIFICHGYSAQKNGVALLIQRPVKWTADGWPELR